ncbi:trans-hexaprenyltranstransferase [Geobacillus sp. 46C-IIa]|uniref:heptaprenyl diphosphate synthase component 1 n=1 Tax=Geobacillus sp. 46C-IIa TaxID=1963025 RepID=UPI0009BF28A3|nr:heptaprenyl diphosphate synthase component 1 [Geobacillus sp. 46C-IIa]OQP06079.1 trans-hexaprenyltranstransferase [Geobacillus sp. 46C-IIa]QNU29653.1 heptaprenyl diphosphate synthase component 1 [Geobacillus sp. 46C-IIa]
MVKLASLKEQIEQLLDHPYLREHVPTPVVDEDRLLLALSMVADAPAAPNEADRYIIAMMLVQIALDTHDEVTDGGDDLRTRQLVVLAGDLYSGLYYDLLARSGDIALIRLFAEAIRDINEQKVRLYEKKAERIDALFAAMGTIESALLAKFADRMAVPQWGQFAYHYLLLRRLLLEREAFARTGTSMLFEQMAHIAFPRAKGLTNEQRRYLLRLCDRYIDHCKEALFAAELPPAGLLMLRVTELSGGFSAIAKKTVEEG